MKRILSIGIAMLLLLSACMPQSADPSGTIGTTAPSTAPYETNPTQSDPIPDDPTDPAPTQPDPTTPTPTDPDSTQPDLTQPTPSEPEPTDPEPTVHPDREKCSVPTGSHEAFFTYKVIGARKLKLYFKPATKHVYDKDPVIFMIPGGGFMEAKLNGAYNIYSAEAKDIQANGFAIAAIEYRVGGEGVTIEEILSDIADGMRFLSYYSDVLNIDPDQFITTGHSAGASAALLLGYAPNDLFDEDRYWSDAEYQVAGVYALSPPTSYMKADDGPFGGYYSSGSKKHIGLWRNSEVRALCSPINYVKTGSIPCKILMGTLDELVSPLCVQHFKDICDAVGVSCEVVWLENGGHGFESRNGQPVSPNYNTERAKIIEFAKSCVK